MKRYIGLTELDDATLVGVEVRARNERGAYQECRGVLTAMMPGEEDAIQMLKVTRLKQDKGIWRPVNRDFAAVLFDVDVWLSPKDVDLTDIKPTTGGQIIPFNGSTTVPVPPANKPAQIKPKAYKKAIDLGIDDEFITLTGNNVRNYDRNNEVIYETGN